MKSVSKLLRENKETKGGSLIGYYPAGFPTVEDSVESLVAMCHDGVDILEIGVPYSDPVMDGEIIQKATEQALENGSSSLICSESSRVYDKKLTIRFWS